MSDPHNQPLPDDYELILHTPEGGKRIVRVILRWPLPKPREN